MVLERLDVLYLYEKNITWLCALNVEGTSKVMNFSQVDILDIVGVVRVRDLTSSPVNAFDLYNLAIFD